jgi:hypothetical protein
MRIREALLPGARLVLFLVVESLGWNERSPAEPLTEGLSFGLQCLWYAGTLASVAALGLFS